MTRLLITIFVCCLWATLSMAGIRSVGLNQTYTTLTSAYNAAVNDDTLLISPGVYSETITSTKRLHWIGAGYDVVTVNGALVLNAGSSGTRVEGIKITANRDNSGAIELAASVDLITISRTWLYNSLASGLYSNCILRTGSPGGALNIDACIIEPVSSGSSDGGRGLLLNGDIVTVRNTVFNRRSTSTSNTIAVVGNPQSVEIENCAILNHQAFGMSNGIVVCRNNVQYDGSYNWGSYPPGTVFSYNASQVAPPGTNGVTLSANPFQNYSTTDHFQYGISDLHLAGGSPCIDAGDPAVLDLDGSRSDMGIYGGPTPHVDGGAPNYPFTIAFDVPSSMTAGQQLPIQATGRIGAGY